jgi:hypothetical protein
VPAFQRALPDLGDADVAVCGRPARLVTSVFGSEGSGSTDPNLEPIDGIGVTVSSGKGDDARGAATYRLRLVAHQAPVPSAVRTPSSSPSARCWRSAGRCRLVAARAAAPGGEAVDGIYRAGEGDESSVAADGWFA